MLRRIMTNPSTVDQLHILITIKTFGDERSNVDHSIVIPSHSLSTVCQETLMQFVDFQNM